MYIRSVNVKKLSVRLSVLILLVIYGGARALAQELPPLIAFEPDTYQGGNQNWMIAQGAEEFIYVANNKGLLEFNGEQWSRYPSPNETIIRSVRAVGSRIYTGCYMDFGYWERDSTGQLHYRSLSTPVKEKMVPDEHFWNIVAYEQYLLFQSLDQLFVYDLEQRDIGVITPPHGIAKLFQTEKGLFFTDDQRQLYALQQGEIKPLLKAPLPVHRIMHLWAEEGQLFLQTAESGRFRLDREQGRLRPLQQQPALLKGKSIYSAITLSNGQHAFGTISDGVYVLSPEGQKVYHMEQADGLTNNTVLTLFEDQRRNLWVGTDNGINCINLAAPIREYTDESGQLGTVYAAQVFDGQLYLGTNQGLFCKKMGASGAFRLVPGTKGQVWSLFAYDGHLFCGHDAGTFLVEGKAVKPIFTDAGTWRFERVPGREQLLLQGNYDGLSVLEKRGGQWRWRNKVQGFDYSARFLVLPDTKHAYVSHEYKGIFGLKLGDDLRQVDTAKAYSYPTKGKNAALAAFRQDVLYASREGLFRLRSFEEGFERDSTLSQVLEQDTYESGKMTVEESGRLWLFAGGGIYHFRQGLLSEEWTVRSVAIPSDMINAMSGYENTARLKEEDYLIGTADGYLRLDLEELPDNEHQLHLTAAHCRDVDRRERSLSLHGGGDISYAFNSLSIHFAVPVYSKYFVPHFQYRLRGFYDEWSPWSTASSADFKNLPYGDYRLEVRSRVGQQLSEHTATAVYAFSIMRPWYWSRLAIALYAMLALGLVYLIHRAYTQYYQAKESKLRWENQQRLEAQRRENELELIRMKNEQLQKDIESKNRELAISTMSLVKKNELLHRIRNQLQASADANRNINSVIRTIDKNTDEKETWNLFKEAFENADQDFFKKIQQRHPSLTNNDLKLCAYLRLNLSSKEIAPLLNISVRSVEVKRYRLRKKMELEHDESLVAYILGV